MRTNLGAMLLLLLASACSSDSGSGPPEEPEEFTKYSALSASFDGGCGVTLSGGVNCWGSRIDVFNVVDSTPVPVTLAEARTTVTGTSRLRCGIGVSERIFCYGTVTQEDLAYTFADAQLSTTWDTKSATMGSNHGCAVRADSTAWCWGSPMGGKRGVLWPTSHPPSLSNLTVDSVETTYRFLTISAATRHTCGVTADHQVACWGDSAGVGGAAITYLHDDNPCRSTAACTVSPVLVPGLANVSSLSATGLHTCAVADGEVYCWGSNGNGQLGSGTTNSPVPVAVSLPEPAVQVVAGGQHSCARTAAKVYCWGQVSDGEPVTPTLVPGSYPAFTTISAGGRNTCGLTAAGAIYCWGPYGSALGLGTGLPSARPVRIAEPVF